MSNILKGLNEGRNYGRDSWDSNMPGYQGDYGGAENFGRRNREWDEDDRIDARIRAEYEQKKQYEQNGKFWLKLKDSQRHLPAGPFVGKQSANQAAIDLLKQQPELKGNLVITAYGPDEQVNELSNNTLASYKKKAGADASAADKAGDYKRGDKRFSGIVKATKKQFDNDAKGVAEGRYDSDDYYNPRMSRDYGARNLHTDSGAYEFEKNVPAGEPGGERGRPQKLKGVSKSLPADAFGRTTGKIPAGKTGRIHSMMGDIDEELDENLNKWFKEKWVRFGPDGKIRGDCARGDDSEGKPKCLPQSKAHSLGKEGRASAASRKRREDPNPERSGKAINVTTKKKSNEGVAEGWREEAEDMGEWAEYVRTKLMSTPEQQRYSVAQQLSRIEVKNFGSELVTSQNFDPKTGKPKPGRETGLTKIVKDTLRALTKPQGITAAGYVNLTPGPQEIDKPDDRGGRDWVVDTNMGWLVVPDAGNAPGRVKRLLYTAFTWGPEIYPYAIERFQETGDFTEQDLRDLRAEAAERQRGERLEETGSATPMLKVGDEIMWKPLNAKMIPIAATVIAVDAEKLKIKIYSPRMIQMRNGNDTMVVALANSEITPKQITTESENPYGYEVGQTVKLDNGQQGRVIDIFDDSIEVLLVGGRTVTVDFRDAHVIDEDVVAEDQLDELKCWPGYTRVRGVPAGAPGSCKKKTNEEGVAEGQEEKCPHCGGAMFSEMIMNEKKDACYYKVKSRYKVWPSAYASGALVKCRKSGADSWGDGGKKSESAIMRGLVDENRQGDK
jgi:hypothetical protein